MTTTVIRNAASPKTAIIYGGLSGPMGRPGPSGTSIVERIASEIIPTLRAVSSISAESVAITDPDDLESINSFLGITIQSALINEEIQVYTTGVMEDPSFSLVPGKLIYIGSDGKLVDNVPNVAHLRKVGIALTATSMAINVGPVIRR